MLQRLSESYERKIQPFNRVLGLAKHWGVFIWGGQGVPSWPLPPFYVEQVGEENDLVFPLSVPFHLFIFPFSPSSSSLSFFPSFTKSHQCKASGTIWWVLGRWWAWLFQSFTGNLEQKEWLVRNYSTSKTLPGSSFALFNLLTWHHMSWIRERKKFAYVQRKLSHCSSSGLPAPRWDEPTLGIIS